MKFVISSTELLNHLQTVSRVISSKNTHMILDNVLFRLTGNDLTIVASDLETTMLSKLELSNADEDGVITLPSKLLIDTLKEFPEQPLSFEIDLDTYGVDIYSENGKFSIVGMGDEEFPKVPEIKEDQVTSIDLDAHTVATGISSTLYATADDELRPMMNGICIQSSPEGVTFVATDAHKLFRYKNTSYKSDKESDFILPKKPANLLKSIMGKSDDLVKLEFDDKNAKFTFSNIELFCRLIEGEYPSYESIIPIDNPYKLIIDRLNFLNTLKRVSVFSNQASNMVKLSFSGNQLTISAQDIDFAISAYERLNCQYEGDDIELGFKSPALMELMANLNSTEVTAQLGDDSRSGVFTPTYSENEDEDFLMLLMPLIIKSQDDDDEGFDDE